MEQPSIEQAIRDVMRTGQVPGVVVAVARGAAPIEYHVAGQDAQGQPLAPDSLFPVASIT